MQADNQTFNQGVIGSSPIRLTFNHSDWLNVSADAEDIPPSLKRLWDWIDDPRITAKYIPTCRLSQKPIDTIPSDIIQSSTFHRKHTPGRVFENV